MLSLRSKETRDRQSIDYSTKTVSKQIDYGFNDDIGNESSFSYESKHYVGSIQTASTESPRNLLAPRGTKLPTPVHNGKVPSFEENIELANNDAAIEIRNDQAQFWENEEDDSFTFNVCRIEYDASNEQVSDEEVPNENEEVILSAKIYKESEIAHNNYLSTATIQSVEEAELCQMRLQKEQAANELIEQQNLQRIIMKQSPEL